MRYTTGIPQDKKVKLIAKASDTIKQNKEYEKLYLSSVRDYNAFMNAYQKYFHCYLQINHDSTRSNLISDKRTGNSSRGLPEKTDCC